MARIAGVDIPNEKRIVISLTYIYGVGPTTAEQIVKATNIDPDKRTQDLSKEELNKLYNYIDKSIVIEGALKQQIYQNIKRLRDIRCYRGVRHKKGLPVRGQRTRKNARTRKGKIKMAVGGLNKKITKK